LMARSIPWKEGRRERLPCSLSHVLTLIMILCVHFQFR
jgi:hypothetical protein